MTFDVMHDRLLHLLTTLPSILDTTRFIALCQELVAVVMEAFSLYETLT